MPKDPHESAAYLEAIKAKGQRMMSAFILLDEVNDQLVEQARSHLAPLQLSPKQPEGKEQLRRFYLELDPLVPVFFKAVKAQRQIESIELGNVRRFEKLRQRSKHFRKKGMLSPTELVDLSVFVSQERKQVFELLAQLKEHMLKLQAATYQPFQNLAQTYLDAYDSMDEVLHDYTLLNVIGTEDEVGDLQYDPALMLFD